MARNPITQADHDTAAPGWSNLLGNLAIFSGLSSADIDKLAGLAQARKMRTGETLMRTGDAGSFMMIVLLGQVRVMLNAASGRAHIVTTLGPGSVIGEIALFDGKPRTADVIAATKGQLLTIERAAVKRLIEADPQFALRIIEMLSGRLRETMAQLESQLFQDVAARLAASLLNLAQGKPKRLDMTQTALGELVGASREIVNKRLRQFEADGFVALSRGRVTVLDEDGLTAQFAEQGQRLRTPVTAGR